MSMIVNEIQLKVKWVRNQTRAALSFEISRENDYRNLN